MENAACGFRIDLPKGWTQAGSASLGGFTFGPAPGSGANESIVLLVLPNATLEEARANVEAGRTSATAGGFLDQGRIVEHGNATLDGRPALRLRVEGTRGTALLAWESRLVDLGSRSLVLSWSVEQGREPTHALRRAIDSFRILDAPTQACGSAPETPRVVEEDGWVTYRQARGDWSMRHPANWSATDLSEDGAAILFSAPPEGPDDPYLDSVLVVLRPGADDVTLDELAQEALDQLHDRVAGFELVQVGNATLDGEPARYVYSREEHRGFTVEGWRLLALRAGTLYWIEALVLPAGGITFAHDLEAAIETFRLDPAAPPAS